MDTQPALLTNYLLHSNSQLEELDPTQTAEAEGDPETAAAEAVVVPDSVRYLSQYLLCRDLVWQAGVLQGAAIRRTPAIPTEVVSGDQTIRLHLGKRPRVRRHAYLQTRVIDHTPPAFVESHSIKSDTILEVLHLMQLSFSPDDEQSISTLSRESMVQESFVLRFTLKDLLQQLLLICLLHLTSLIS